MNGHIDDRTPSYLLDAIEKQLGIKIEADDAINLIFDVIKPHLQHSYNEGIRYTQSKLKTHLGKMVTNDVNVDLHQKVIKGIKVRNKK